MIPERSIREYRTSFLLYQELHMEDVEPIARSTFEDAVPVVEQLLVMIDGLHKMVHNIL